MCICASGDQLFHGLCAARAVSANHDVIVEAPLDVSHQPSVPSPSKYETVCCPHKGKHYEKPDGRNYQRVEQTRLFTDRNDIAIPSRRDADHRKIEDIDEAEWTAGRIPKTVPFCPMNSNRQDHQPDRK